MNCQLTDAAEPFSLTFQSDLSVCRSCAVLTEFCKNIFDNLLNQLNLMHCLFQVLIVFFDKLNAVLLLCCLLVLYPFKAAVHIHTHVHCTVYVILYCPGARRHDAETVTDYRINYCVFPEC